MVRGAGGEGRGAFGEGYGAKGMGRGGVFFLRSWAQQDFSRVRGTFSYVSIYELLCQPGRFGGRIF